MANILMINVPTRDAPGRSRTVRASDKLAATTGQICKLLSQIANNLSRAQGSLNAASYVIAPPAEVQAMRDRAAFDRRFADERERERQQILRTQAAADKFYGRTGK